MGISRSDELEECLCLPGLRVRVPRPRTVVLRARMLSQMPVRFAAAGALAWILQHQLDHLDGILPTERRFGRRCRTLSFASPPPAWAEPHA